VVFPVKRKNRSARRNSFAFLVCVIPRNQPWLDTNRPDYLISRLQEEKHELQRKLQYLPLT
jgi:hypothetical protein